MKTTLHLFPFDLFGSPGTRAGAELLTDALRELLADNRRDPAAARARAYTRHVRVEESTLDTVEDLGRWRAIAAEAIERVRRRGDRLFWIAGNHLGVLPLYDHLSEQARDTLVVQLDAHLDIHQFRDCQAELSHGNFLLHARSPQPQLINVGHRDLLLGPEAIARRFRETFPAEVVAQTPDIVIDRIRAAADEAAHVFIDIDCDVFDVAYFPGIAQSLPFGLSPTQVLHILSGIDFRKVLGLSLSEFDTARDVRDQSLATLVWLVEWALLRIYESRAD